MTTVRLPISLSSLDHELRLPLTGILGFANFLQEDPLTATQQKYIEGILESSKQLLKLADTLAYSASEVQKEDEVQDVNIDKQPGLTKKTRILLVEDNPVVQFIHKKMLLDLDFNVDVASDGREAIEIAENEYDVILMDLGLPDMSGIEAVAQIRNSKQAPNKKTRIVALTAYTQEKTHEECFKAGIDEVAIKPIEPKKLCELIQGASRF